MIEMSENSTTLDSHLKILLVVEDSLTSTDYNLTLTFHLQLICWWLNL